MNREFISNFYKISFAVIGGLCVILALLNLKSEIFTSKFVVIFLFTVLVAPRIVIALPRSKFLLSFSDSMIFLTFLLLGGEAAIIIATIERLASCLFLKLKGATFNRYTLLFNVGSVSASTTVAYLIFTLFSVYAGISSSPENTTKLVTILGILALAQFLADSVFASLYHTLKTDISFWNAWKKEGIPTSMTYFLGAGFAGVIFKLLNYADIGSIMISLIAFVFIYLTYRRIISEMTSSIEQAEQAERDKAETEREKRIEIEKYAEELSLSLKKEEKTGKALLKSQRAFQHQAQHDSLTGLPNRAYFGEILKEMILETKASGCEDSYVLFLDLARFKTINDSLGHSIGDKVLIVVAKRFAKMLRAGDIIARLGGDEFAIILRNLQSVEKAERVAWKVHQQIAQPFSLSKNKIYTSVNIGIAPCRVDYETPEEILRDADIAMHYAKEKDLCVGIFNTDLRERFVEKAVLEGELRQALERKQLSMHYQPIVSLKDGLLIGFEALLRWIHHEKGFISPAQFIPIAENSGLIVPITTWILKETCQQLADWQKISPSCRELIMSVNISGKHLTFQSLLIDVEDALECAGLAPSFLKLEITESAAMENPEQSIRMLSHLKSLGVQLSIDDFGTGYSSLSYLHRLPFNTLKIDRSFVAPVGENGEGAEILQTIISLAKNLRMRVIAEGIETEAQLNILRNLGCDYGQGYFMSKPLPKVEMEQHLHKKQFWLPDSETSESVSQIAEAENIKNLLQFRKS